ncbi:hypothetical protein MMPV_010080 [Pyropia vietnamensis]
MDARVARHSAVPTKQRSPAAAGSPLTTPPSSPPPLPDAAAQVASPRRRCPVVPSLSPEEVLADSEVRPHCSEDVRDGCLAGHDAGGAPTSLQVSARASTTRERAVPPLSSGGGGSPSGGATTAIRPRLPAGRVPLVVSPETAATASSPRSPRSAQKLRSPRSPRSPRSAQSLRSPRSAPPLRLLLSPWALGGTGGTASPDGGGDQAATAGTVSPDSADTVGLPRGNGSGSGSGSGSGNGSGNGSGSGSGSGSGRSFRMLMSPRRAAVMAASPKSRSSSGERWRVGSRLRRGNTTLEATTAAAEPSGRVVCDEGESVPRSSEAASTVHDNVRSARPSSSPLSADTVRIVKTTASVLEVHGGAIAAAFYRILFENHPSTSIFFDTTSTGDATVQSDAQIRRLAGAVLAFAANVEHLDALAPALARISAKHVSRGVAAGLYAPVGQVLLMALAEVLGDAATPEVLSAWADAYAYLSAALITRERALRTESAAAAAEGGDGGTWLGYAPFKVNRRVQETVSAGMAISLWLEPISAPAMVEGPADGDVAAEAPPVAPLLTVDWAAGQYVGVYLPGADGGLAGSIRRTVPITSMPRSAKGLRITFFGGSLGDRDNGTAHFMGARVVVRRAAAAVPAVFVVSEQGSVELFALAVEVMKAGREVYFVRVGHLKSNGEAAWVSPAAVTMAAEAVEATAGAMPESGTAAGAAAVSALATQSPRRRAMVGRSWKGAFGTGVVVCTPDGRSASGSGSNMMNPKWRRVVRRPRAADGGGGVVSSSPQHIGQGDTGNSDVGDSGSPANAGSQSSLTGRWTVVERAGAPERASVVSPADCLFGLELLTAELSTSTEARLHQLLVAVPEEVTAAVGATVTAAADWFLGSVPLSLLDEVRAHLVDAAGVDPDRVLFAEGV